MARLERDDVHRWVFVDGMNLDVESAVLKWLYQRLDGFYCELQLMYTPHVRSTSLARTHIVLNNTPPLPSMARNDEAVEVDGRGLNALGTVKALIKATGLNPHLSVRGWPSCLDELDDANTKGCATGSSCTPAPHAQDERKER
jgi:hypothetical protein